MADVFESDIAPIKRRRRRRTSSFPYGGAPPLDARVNYIQPQVDPMTRTLKVRLDAANPGMRAEAGHVRGRRVRRRRRRSG